MPYHSFYSRDVLQYKVGLEFMIKLDSLALVICFSQRKFSIVWSKGYFTVLGSHCDLPVMFLPQQIRCVVSGIICKPFSYNIQSCY